MLSPNTLSGLPLPHPLNHLAQPPSCSVESGSAPAKGAPGAWTSSSDLPVLHKHVGSVRQTVGPGEEGTREYGKACRRAAWPTPGLTKVTPHVAGTRVPWKLGPPAFPELLGPWEARSSWAGCSQYPSYGLCFWGSLSLYQSLFFLGCSHRSQQSHVRVPDSKEEEEIKWGLRG